MSYLRRPTSRIVRERVFQRSNGYCEKQGCGLPIELETFHAAHLRGASHGGPPIEENLQAWCSRCNLTQGAIDVADTRLRPREWQLEALDRVIKRIINDRAATVSAAPGAGKTVFAGLVFEALYEADVVDRMVVLAPSRTIVSQWATALRATRHIELKPHAELERAGQHGVIVTYQSLGPETALIHRAQAEHRRTLLIADEVHHVGEPVQGRRPAWARWVHELTGTVDTDLHVAGVLNLSGTLWRSNKTERISTVRYRTVDDELESQVDYSIAAEQLIEAGELRPLDLYRLNARIELNDMAELEVIQSDMADLDEKPARAAVAALANSGEWREAFVRAVLDRLEQAHRSLDGHHVKALIVARLQEEAYVFCDEVNRQMRARGLQPLSDVAVSDEPEAQKVLTNFRQSQRVGVLCTVGMAGEGYDCPDIAVIGYASNKLTTLHVRQVVARAMRVTDIERKLGRIIPAAIVLPDAAPLVETLVSYLAPFTHRVLMPEEVPLPEPGFDRDGNPLTTLPLARYIVEEILPTEETVTISHNGTVSHFEASLVQRVAEALQDFNVPPVYAPRVLAASRRTVGDLLQDQPFDPLSQDADQLNTLTAVRGDSIEDKSRILQQRLRRFEGWWHHNGETNIALFAAEANRTAGIPTGGRDQATPAQLQRAVNHERAVIGNYCARTGKRGPRQ